MIMKGMSEQLVFSPDYGTRMTAKTPTYVRLVIFRRFARMAIHSGFVYVRNLLLYSHK